MVDWKHSFGLQVCFVALDGESSFVNDRSSFYLS